MTLLRAGTYIYHSHLNDAHQVASGLYGPIIVMGENQFYDPKTDHVYIVGWKNINPQTKFIAKDGTDLPTLQQTCLKESAYFGVGETADFEFKPLKAGNYNLQVVIVDGVYFWNQKWIVTD